MEYEQDNSPSLRRKLKTTFFCASGHEYSKVLEGSSDNNNPTIRLSTWLKLELPEIKGLFSGKIGRNRHRRNSAEFSYDPLSYALNFDHGESRMDHQYPLPNFSSRIPPSPAPEKENAVVFSQIAACS
uniref:Uncharacterized protein n=1 Tax=Opuntia streptacantha TaxID=393608 RepID=A0A7C8ZD22_OPUST